jgi:hypothetical protein
MDRERALEVMKERGNLVKFEQVSHIKKLIYPDEAKLLALLEGAQSRLTALERKHGEWGAKLGEVKRVRNAGLIARLKDPVYRRHLKQKLSSKDYREPCRIVNPPFTRLRDPSMRPMLRKFVEDAEYRETLAKTKEGFFSDASFGEGTDRGKGVIDKRLSDLVIEIRKERDYRDACMAMLEWCKKSKSIVFRKPVKGTY